MIVLIDNGHGSTTLGKRSPDESVAEYKYCRDIANILVTELRKIGVDARLLTPELEDTPLRDRVARANEICDRFGANNVLLVSIHLNASADNGEWQQPKGWGVYISNNASAKSKQFAESIAKWAEVYGMKVRKPKPNQWYWEQNLAICRDSKCPAVLTENLFMDNKDDVQLLLTEKGKQLIVQTHYDAILDWVMHDYQRVETVEYKK